MTSKINPVAESRPALPSQRRIPVWLWVAVPLAVIGFFGWQWWVSSRSIATDNAYIKADRILVAPQIGGRVVEVAVGQNQAVKQGDLLFKIDTAPLEIAVAQNEAQVARMANSASASRAQVQGADSSIAAARETLAWAQRDLARLQDLSRQQLVARKMVDDARHVVAEARTDLASAIASQNQASAALSGKVNTPTTQLPEYRSALAQLDKARLDLAHAEVRAPVDGVVGMHDLQVGEYINVGQSAMPLVATSPIWVEANFKETELAKMKIGQPATLTVDSYPGVKWKARVASISPASGGEFSVLPAQNATGNWVKIVQRIPVRLEIDGVVGKDAPILRSGMSAEVDVDLREPGASASKAKATH